MAAYGTTVMDCNSSMDLFDYFLMADGRRTAAKYFVDWIEANNDDNTTTHRDAESIVLGERNPAPGLWSPIYILGTSVFLIFHSRRASMTDLFFFDSLCPASLFDADNRSVLDKTLISVFNHYLDSIRGNFDPDWEYFIYL